MNIYRIASAGPTLIRSLGASLIQTSPSPLNYLDIGARGGLPRRWQVLERRGKIRPVYIEADADSAAELARKGRALCAALGSEDGSEAELKITRDPFFSSILEPVREKWPPELSQACEVVDRRSIQLSRLDTIWPEEFGDPHYVKLDTQGYDLEVLRGFGSLLGRVWCAEVETRIAQQYCGQPTVSELYEYMNENGFELIALRSNGLQAGRGMMVFNAFFVRSDALGTATARMWKIVNDLGSANRLRTKGY